MASNRRKRSEATIQVASTSTSGATAVSENAASADAVLFLIGLTTLTAGSITFSIQTFDPIMETWHSLSTSEMSGDTGAITAIGNYHISTRAPMGVQVRLRYVIVTGPAEFTVTPIYERSGGVY